MPESPPGLNRLVQVLEEFRKVDSSMSANTVSTFLLVAQQNGVKQYELEEKLGISQAGMSRIIATLSEFQGFNKAGFNLVEAVPNPQDRRHKIVSLTRKGEKLAERVRVALEGK